MSRVRPALPILIALLLVPATLGAQPPEPGLETPAERPSRPAGYDRLGEPVTLDRVGSGSLLLATEVDDVYLPAPNLETRILVRATGMLARTEVRQRFHNPTDAWVEGVYVFPLPERSAVDTLHMIVGDRVIEGQIRERQEARETYEQARAEGRRASLVEQERPNLFTTSVANVGPDETVEVVIGYQEELRYDGGIFSLRLPLVAAPRFVPGPGGPARIVTAGLDRLGAERSAETLRRATAPVPDRDRITPPVALGSRSGSGPGDEPLHPVTLTVELDAGFPVERMGSTSHALHVSRGAAGEYRIRAASGDGIHAGSRESGPPPSIPADRDFVLEWAPAVGAEPATALFTEEVDGEHYALVMVMPPSEPATGRPLPREAVFVIDTSGSMHGASLDQARGAVLEALDRLRPEDSFNVIRFSDRTDRLFQESLPAEPRALEMARAYVRNLEAGGGTMMRPALEAALRGGRHTRTAAPAVRQVVFVTDGAVANEAELFRTIRELAGDSRLFPVGIGSAPNGHFMRRAAELARGTFTYIGTPDDVGPKMGELFSKIDSPVLTDLEVEWSDPAAEGWPERMPDLYLGEPVVVAARLPSSGPAAGSGIDGAVRIRALRGATPWTVDRDLASARSRPGIARLWARRKIAALADRGLAGAPPEVVRAEIVEVALAHHLVSEHTSLVAVDVTPSRPAHLPQRSTRLPVSLPAGWVEEHVLGGLPNTGTPSRLALLLGLVALGAGLALARSSRRARRPGGGRS